MAKQTYRLTNGMDTTVQLRIDKDKLPHGLAIEIATFNSNPGLLKSVDGDAYAAVAKLAASRIAHEVMDGLTNDGAVMQISESDGWPEDMSWLEVVAVDLPDFDAIEWGIE